MSLSHRSTAISAPQPDILPGFRRQTITLAPDDEGTVVATLIQRETPMPQQKAVLYLHGYIDYFFQEEMASQYADHGFDFYALDLRKYGRSLLPNQKPNYALSVEEYYEEIDIALDLIRSRHHYVVLSGHSTGGLTGALYADARRGQASIDAAFFNSPFFDMNGTWLNEHVLVPAASAVGAVSPTRTLPSALSPLYFDSVHRSQRGEWDFRTDWKPRDGFPMYAGWVRAIRDAQLNLQAGLQIDVPTLVMHSSESSRPSTWDDILLCTDSVLDVEDIDRYAGVIGSDVTKVSIGGGMHDLVLSAEPVREEVYRQLFAWLDRAGK